MIHFWKYLLRSYVQRPLSGQGPLRALLALCCVVVVASGCHSAQSSRATTARESVQQRAQFSELNILMAPFGVEVGSDHSKKAVAIQVFAVKPGSAKGSAILQGELEMQLFNGAYQLGMAEELPLIKTWRYTPEELRSFSKQSLLGVGYQLLLVWEDEERLFQKKVTVRALYHDPNGSVVASEFGVIPLTL